MSQPMKNAKEIVEKLMKEAEEESLSEPLQNIGKLIDQNKDKIWLRTRSGKPIAAKMETTATEVIEMFKEEVKFLPTKYQGILYDIDRVSDILELKAKMDADYRNR